MPFSAILLTVFAYLLGSVSAAIVTCRIMGLPDPRSEGSHNPGATNVYKVAGKKAAAITLAGDVFKGLVPVLMGRLLGLDDMALALIAMAAFLGHLFPLFFHFKGGKGVATALGVILGLNVMVAAVMVVTWLMVLRLFKLSSLSAVITALLTPLYFYYIDGSAVFTVMSGILSAMLIVRHRSNIEKIIDGTED